VLGRQFARVQARRAPSVAPGVAPSAPLRRREPTLEVVASRTFVVDVHTLAGP
jgi:hypothetical protein